MLQVIYSYSDEGGISKMQANHVGTTADGWWMLPVWREMGGQPLCNTHPELHGAAGVLLSDDKASLPHPSQYPADTVDAQQRSYHGIFCLCSSHQSHMELGSVQSSMWQILDIACRESHGKCPTSAWMTAHNPHGSSRGLSPAWADNPGFRSSEHLWVLCTAAGLMTMVSPGRRPSLPLSGIPTARQAFPYCDARRVCLAAGSQLLYI